MTKIVKTIRDTVVIRDSPGTGKTLEEKKLESISPKIHFDKYASKKSLGLYQLALFSSLNKREMHTTEEWNMILESYSSRKVI